MDVCIIDAIIQTSMADVQFLMSMSMSPRRASVERLTSDKGRYPTAQLICFCVLDLDL